MLGISLCIYFTPIEVEDFTPYKAALGVYKYTPGSYKASARAEIVSADGTSYDAACEVGIFGSDYPCAVKELNGKTVYIEYAKYPKLWWHSYFVMSMELNKESLRNWSRANFIEMWLRNSYKSVANISAGIAMFSLAFLYGSARKK